MITDGITKREFIVRSLEADVGRIYKTQRDIAEKNLYVSGSDLKVTRRAGKTIGRRTGALMQSLLYPEYDIRDEGGKTVVYAKIVKQMRYLDMKRLGDWKIYNRQLWGILYNHTIRELRFGYGNAAAAAVGESLREAFGGQHGSSSGSSPGNSSKKENTDGSMDFRQYNKTRYR